MNTRSPLPPYRPNVCMLLRNKQGKFWLGERHGEAGVWQFPQGGEQNGKTTEQSVIEELHEELGAPRELFRIVYRFIASHQYDFTKPRKYGKEPYRGQRQSFWLVDFLGTDDQINVARFEQEFGEWRWCTVAEIRALAEPKRLIGYEGPLAELATLPPELAR